MPRRCEAIGLVNRVVPDDKLQGEAFALAKSIAEGPTIAMRYMKDNLDEALIFDFATARDHEAERLVRHQDRGSPGGGAGLHREAQGGVQGEVSSHPAWRGQCSDQRKNSSVLFSRAAL